MSGRASRRTTEVFGPVAAIIEAADEQEAIAIANASEFGLGSGVLTSDLARGERIAADELDAGMSFVNDNVRSDPRMPFGGVKHSGFGRECAGFGIRVRNSVVADQSEGTRRLDGASPRATPTMKRIAFPGDTVSARGQHLNLATSRPAPGDRALRLGIDLGLTLIDTADITYAARIVVARRSRSARQVFFVTSLSAPASRRASGAFENSCAAAHRTIALYLLHWPGAVPLVETVEAFEALQRAGKIRHWGVSNLDRAQMEALRAVPGGAAAQTDQVLYNLGRRGIEWDLLPWLRQHRVPAMAYSPIEQGRLLRRPGLSAFARQQAMTPAQAALAWLLAQDDSSSSPRPANGAVEENAGASPIRSCRRSCASSTGCSRTAGPSALEML